MPAVEPQLLIDQELERTLMEPPVGPLTPRRTKPVENLRGIGTKALCRFVRQLSTLLHAGMPLVPALSALVEQLQCPTNPQRRKPARDPLAQVVEHVRDSVNEGGSLAEALSRYPGLFSPLFVNMVSAGERSGALEEVLLRLAEILERRVQLLGKIRSAVVYPAMMAAVAVGVVVFLLTYVVPSITQMFVQMNQQLPLPTRLLMGLSGIMRTYFIVVLALPCVAIACVYGVHKTCDGKRRLDRIKLALPLFGPLLLKLEVARLTRTLGTAMKSGIPVTTALEIARRVVQNQVIADAVGKIENQIHRGDAIADAVRSTRIFPPVVFHLLATGQMTGSVEDTMTNIAQMYETEVENSIKTLTTLLEPMILLVMGAVVGFIVLSILLPIYEINQAL
ncbi:MAG: type II secretion system F family protein [Sedimentisphaerales bacterium]|nr:type II secretion system F family protein [Sedimentisphaerales bacterium]